jgi:hypothetical protein
MNPNANKIGYFDFKGFLISHILGKIPEGSILIYHDGNFKKNSQYWESDWCNILNISNKLLNDNSSDIFFQWLEGPKDSVVRLMHNIRNDKRHNTLVELSVNEEVRERMFPTWDMELVQPDDIREVLQDALRDAKAAVHAKALRELMQMVEEADLP